MPALTLKVMQCIASIIGCANSPGILIHHRYMAYGVCCLVVLGCTPTNPAIERTLNNMAKVLQWIGSRPIFTAAILMLAIYFFFVY